MFCIIKFLNNHTQRKENIIQYHNNRPEDVMNIIIVGCGKVGSTLAGQLSQEGHDISIIDINDQVVEEFSNSYDVMGVTGNGASYTIQRPQV